MDPHSSIAHMNGIGIIFFTFISIATLDLLTGQLQRFNRETSYFKSMGLWGQLVLALSPNQIVYNQISSIKRFFIALITTVLLLLAIFLILLEGFSHEKGMTVVMLCLAPLMAMPFYHFLFALLGIHPTSIYSSIKNFRLRGILAIVMSANIIFVFLSYAYNLFFQFVHLSLTFIALSHIFFLVTKMRAKRTYNNAHDEERESGSVGLIHYLNMLLEFFYYSLLVFFVYLQNIAATYLTEEPLMIVVPILLAICYIIIMIIVKLLFIEHSAPTIDFYERIVLPFSFVFFGLIFIYQSFF